MAKTPPFQFRVKIPDQYSAVEREAIAAEIISEVRQRTLKGKDFEGNNFPKYSKSYIDSVNFKAAGKSKGKINLTLSGDMLAFLDLQSNKPGEIVIGYEDGTTEAGKAEGNQIGSYGQPSGNPSKARKFLGITQEDLERILEKYPIDDRAERRSRAEAVQEAAETIDEFAEEIRQEGLEETDPKKLAKKFKLRIG